jgi:hypothetical protein
MDQLQDVYSIFLHHRQKYISTIESGYSRNAQTAAVVPKVLEPLFRSQTYTACG